MLQVTNLSKGYGGQSLFSEVQFSLNRRERVGLVGRNGSGKSTLFKMLLGKESPDSGQISFPKNYSVGTLEQHIHFTKDTVLEECTQVLGENALFESYKAEKLLMGLGFSEEDFDKAPGVFSGGFQLRINLVKALLKEPNLLLLDEPTNYLDIVSLRWLKSFLKSFPGEIILITHDRDFLDSVTTHTMGFYRQRLKKVQGGSAKFYELLALEDDIHQKTKENLDKKRKQLELFVTRFRAKASKATQAQSKMKQLERMGTMDDLKNESVMHFSFRYKDIQSRHFLKVRDLSFRYSEKTPWLIRDLNFEVNRGDRVAIVGKNGKGKSTLINVLARELKAQTGEIHYHNDIHRGHFGQTNVNRLHLNHTVETEVALANPMLERTAVRSICGAMLFTGDLAEKKISVLSGGERNRVLLGKILATPTNFLLLDEPTNHLDMESVDILVDEIENFPGAVVIVTHSEYILRRVATKLIVFQKGKCSLFNGTYDEFLKKVGFDEEERENRDDSTPSTHAHAKADPAPETSGQEPAKKVNNQKMRAHQKRLKRLNKDMEKVEGEISGLEEEVSKREKRLETEKDVTTIIDLTKEIADFQKKVEKKFQELEDLEIKIQELENGQE